MKITSIRWGAAAVSLAFACTAQGAYTGLQLQFVGEVNTSAGPKKVFRIYAEFNQGSDRVVSWGGNLSNPTVLSTVHCTVPTLQLGAPFYNHRFGGNTAPVQALVNVIPEVQWDTFVTIGVSIADQGSGVPPNPPDETRTSGDFSTLSSNHVMLTNATVFTATPNAPQARADYAGDGDPQLRVLLGQFTTGANEHFAGVIGTLTVSSDGTPTIFTNQTWFEQSFGWGACCLPNGCGVMSGLVCGIAGGTLVCECEDCPHTCLGDIVVNGVVDVNDLLAVITTWGPCPLPCGPGIPHHCPPDVAPAGFPLGDCIVNADDLLQVITAWGPCP